MPHPLKLDLQRFARDWHIVHMIGQAKPRTVRLFIAIYLKHVVVGFIVTAFMFHPHRRMKCS